MLEIVADHNVAQPSVGGLTGSGRKLSAFSENLYFRECWADAAAVLGSDPLPVLERTALIITKPDAVVGRRLRRILSYSEDHGFVPLAAIPLALTRHSIRELWRDDWSAYSVDRLALATTFYTAADTLAVFLRDVEPEPGLAGCARLCRLKGSAFPELRAAENMRTVLAPPNRVLNFVHVPDEPIDLVREIGILFDRPERRALFRQIQTRLRDGDSFGIESVVAGLEQRFAAHDLDFERSLDRLLTAGLIARETAQRLATLRAAKATLPWEEFCRLVERRAGHPHLWDFITIASHLIPLERDDGRDAAIS